MTTPNETTTIRTNNREKAANPDSACAFVSTGLEYFPSCRPFPLAARLRLAAWMADDQLRPPLPQRHTPFGFWVFVLAASSACLNSSSDLNRSSGYGSMAFSMAAANFRETFGLRFLSGVSWTLSITRAKPSSESHRSMPHRVSHPANKCQNGRLSSRCRTVQGRIAGVMARAPVVVACVPRTTLASPKSTR